MNKTQPYLYQYPPKTYINAPSADTSYEEIIQQIEALDRQNKKLVSIAENIMKTSFIRQTEQTPAVILQLQEDMKMSFNTLIESIREFFMSIDAKLKELGVAIEGKVGDLEIAGSRCSGKAENDKLEMLTMRMAYMEENIKKAQENEARLISIIEEMNNNKRYLSEEQPTIRKEPERGLPLAACKQGTNSQPETSFRLFSMGYPPEKPLYQPQQNQPTYKKFQQYSNHPVVQSLGPSTGPYQQSFGRQYAHHQAPQFLCVAARNEEQVRGNHKKVSYLKSSAHEFQIESSNRIHRLSNLLKGLKQ